MVFIIEDHRKEIRIDKKQACARVSCNKDWEKLLLTSTHYNYFCNDHVPSEIEHQDERYKIQLYSYMFPGITREQIMKEIDKMHYRAYYFTPRLIDRNSLEILQEYKHSVLYIAVVPKDGLNVVKNGIKGIHYLLKRDYIVACGSKREYIDDLCFSFYKPCKKRDSCNKWKKIRKRLDEDVRNANITRNQMVKEGKTVQFLSEYE